MSTITFEKDTTARGANSFHRGRTGSGMGCGQRRGLFKDLASDVSFTNLFGMVMYGAAAFAERHQHILATFYKGTTKHHIIRRSGLSHQTWQL